MLMTSQMCLRGDPVVAQVNLLLALRLHFAAERVGVRVPLREPRVLGLFGVQRDQFFVLVHCFDSGVRLRGAALV
jgi:hypothetical protein